MEMARVRTRAKVRGEKGCEVGDQNIFDAIVLILPDTIRIPMGTDFISTTMVRWKKRVLRSPS